MRDLPEALKLATTREDTALCYLLSITLKNGTVYRYTDNSQSVVYNNHVWYADPGIDVSAIRETTDSANMTATVTIGYQDNMITEEMARRGGLEDATHQVVLVDWRTPDMGGMEIFSGAVAKLTASNKYSCTLDLTGWQGKFFNLNGVYSLKCRNVFCDKGCKLDINDFKVPFEMVADSADGVTLITTGNLAPESGAFGSIEWTSGKNAGNITGVATNDASVIYCTIAPGYRPRVGDAGFLRAGCDYYKQTCENRYNNLINFQGEPSTPQGKTTSADKSVTTKDPAKPPTTDAPTYAVDSGESNIAPGA